MHRFQSRPQFQAALAGPTKARTAHFALHVAPLHGAQGANPAATGDMPSTFPAGGVWIGAMVPKRWAKRAVTRNTIKRQIYTVSAEFETTLQPHAHLVRLRVAFDRSRFISASSDALKAAVRAELHQLFAQSTSSRASP